LPYKDDKGRYVATARLPEYQVQVIDKEDRLGEFLCDEDYTLRIAIEGDQHFTRVFENRIKGLLEQAGIVTQRSVWAPDRNPAET
jgi:hypothetical protein